MAIIEIPRQDLIISLLYTPFFLMIRNLNWTFHFSMTWCGIKRGILPCRVSVPEEQIPEAEYLRRM
jgi:hypothetical protein